MRRSGWVGATACAAAVAVLAVAGALVRGGPAGPTADPAPPVPSTPSGAIDQPATDGPALGVPAPGVPTEFDASFGKSSQKVPTVVVAAGDRQLSLRPWTYCYGNGCADGSPELLASIDDIGSPASVTLWIAKKDWDIEATFVDVTADCPRRETTSAVRLDAHTFRLDPMDAAGTYRVDLFAHGDGGDVAASFAWTTPVDGGRNDPGASLALLADHDGALDSYGLELSLSGLADTPSRATATVTVTDASGATASFAPQPQPQSQSRSQPQSQRTCYQRGSVGFRIDRPDISALGEGPYVYDVQVTLDGVSHTARATWPDDQTPDNEPYVPLTFTPPLPSAAR